MIAPFHKELRIPRCFTRSLGYGTVCACTFGGRGGAVAVSIWSVNTGLFEREILNFQICF